MKELPGRFPRGKRGLKSHAEVNFGDNLGRFPRGKRGLKYRVWDYKSTSQDSRFPRGKRGLKFAAAYFLPMTVLSLPSREAWIEIINLESRKGRRPLSLPSREAWIEIIIKTALFSSEETSLPPREAWIEIFSKTRQGVKSPKLLFSRKGVG